MTEPLRPTFLRRKLGAKLRRLREEAGLTLDTAAPKLDRKRSALPTVTIQVILLHEGTHYVPNGTFNLLRFPDPEDQELLYVEYPTGSLHVEKPDEVREARKLFDQLRSGALSPGDSIALIERLTTELYSS